MNKKDEAHQVFVEDIRERKQYAKAARGVVNGSRSKKCTLPSDYLTAGQKKKLNGEVKTYKMNIPMTYKEFKELPEVYQERYLAGLIDKYNVGLKQLGEMLGCANSTLNRIIRLHDWKSVRIKEKGHRMTRDELKTWNEFLDLYRASKAETPELSNPVLTSSSDVLDANELKPVDELTPVLITKFNIAFDGFVKFEDVFAQLKKIVGDSYQGHVEITLFK